MGLKRDGAIAINRSYLDVLVVSDRATVAVLANEALEFAGDEGGANALELLGLENSRHTLVPGVQPDADYSALRKQSFQAGRSVSRVRLVR